MENDDVDPGELSRLTSLQLGLDVKDVFHRFKISKLYSSFFVLLEVESREVGVPLDGRVCSCFSSLWRIISGVYFSDRKQSKKQCGPHLALTKQRFSRTHGAAWFRASLIRAMMQSRAPKKLFYVYVDNLCILGTSRVNVAEDLRMAVQTSKSRGLDTHEEIVHSDTVIVLRIHIDLRNMLVSVTPMRL